MIVFMNVSNFVKKNLLGINDFTLTYL